MENKRQLWYKYEKQVEKLLIKQWYKIVARNYTIRGWEIDLIAVKDDVIHFVEVKSSNFVEDFQDYITKSKIKSLVKTAKTWMYKNPGDFLYQFDLAIVKDNEIDYIENFIN